MKKKLIVFSILLLAVSVFATSSNLLQYGESNVNRDGVTKENSNHFTTRDILLEQLPNGVNGLFCDASYTQVIAENFVLGADMTIEGLVIWGGNFPNNIPMTDDYLTVAFHTDAAGAIGTMISTEVDVPYVKSLTGLQLFGVDEWIYTLTLATPVDLTAGTYWVEFYNTTGGPYPTVDTFFWETGDVDPVNGIVGSAWATVAPGAAWNYDTATDLSIQILGSGGGGTYCDATTTYEDEYIGNVLCAEINNTTGWQGGVADYTAMSATIEVGGSEDIFVTNGGWPYSSDAVTCWVDWNNDYVWELGGAEEYVLTSDGTGAFFDGVIAVPAGTSLGLHRMRVRMVYSAVPDPCGNSSYGEVEDYSINVVAGGPAGDTCETAIPVGEVVGFAFDTTGLTTSGFDTHSIYSDIFFEYTPTADGTVYVGVCNNTAFDTKIAMYGECDVTTELGYNDDSCGLQSELFDIPVVAGEDYYIQVGGYSSSNWGPGELDIILTSSFVSEPPTNLFVTGDGYATWDAPAAGATSEWLIYDTDVVGFSGIGAEVLDYSLIWASKWVPADLTAYDTGYVTKVAVNQYTDPTGVDYVTEVRVMSGDGMTVLYTQDVTGMLTIGWNEIVLDSAVPFDNTENLWIGMYVERPGGTANEPTSPVVTVGLDLYDFFAYNGAPWTSIYLEYSFDNQAWMLRGFVSTDPAGRSVALGHVDLDLKLEKGYYTEYTESTPTGNGMIAADSNHEYTKFSELTREFLGYNVYLDGAFVTFTTDLFYQYTGLVNGTTYLAEVTADYDEGESDPIDYTFTYGIGTPVIAVTPMSISETLEPEDVVVVPITIENTGTGSLTFSISIVETSDALGGKTFAPVHTTVTPRVMIPDRTLEYSPMETQVFGNVTDEIWDVQGSFRPIDASGGIVSQAGMEFDGTYFYCPVWNSGDICKYDIDGNFVETFQVAGVSGTRDLAYDGEYMYGGSSGSQIYCWDPVTYTLITTINSSAGVYRAIAYDSVNDGFLGNNWDGQIVCTARDGSTLYIIPDTGIASSYGMAYDNASAGGPFLWIFSQAGSGAEIHQVDIASGLPTGVMHDVLSDFPSVGIAGGLWISPDYLPGTVTIGGLIQGEDAFMYELCPGEELWVTADPLSGTVTAGSSVVVDVTLDATDLFDITKTADIVISNNAGADVIVDVTMIVSGDPISDPPSNVAVDDVAGTVSWSAPVVGGVIYEDDLESYTVGDYLAVQSADWTTWSNAPGTGEDALISDVQALSGSNSVVVEGASDLVLIMDNYTSGVYSISLNLFVPTGNSGYWNLQKTNTIGQEWAFQILFETDGIATADAGAAAAFTFAYAPDTWINMELVIDLDADWCDIYVDGVMEFGYQWTLGTFGTPGLLSLGGMNLFASGGSPLCYFDDITLSEVGSDTRDLIEYNVYLDASLVSSVAIDVFEFTYSDLVAGQDYIAGVSAVYDDGESVIVEVPFTFNGTEGDDIVIAATKLHGNYPNPFNPVTNIAYSIKTAGKVTLQVYNIKGQLVKTLVNEVMETGDHTAIWSGKDNAGKSVSSGVYFYKMKASNYTATKKMILMK